MCQQIEYCRRIRQVSNPVPSKENKRQGEPVAAPFPSQVTGLLSHLLSCPEREREMIPVGSFPLFPHFQLQLQSIVLHYLKRLKNSLG